MTVARSVGDVLTEHVVFEIDCVDRLYCNVYVPQLQYAAGLVGYVHRQLGLPIASTAPLARITEALDKAVHRFARDHDVPWVDFAKGQRKDDVSQGTPASSPRRGDPLRRQGAGEGPPVPDREAAQRRTATYPWMVDHRDGQPLLLLRPQADFGPFFLKVCTYFPYNAKLCINGHEYVKRQLARRGSPSRALDNGILSCGTRGGCSNLRRTRARQDRRAAAEVAGLPHPFTPMDRRLSLRHVDPPGRVLPDPGAGPAAGRPRLLRGGDPREPRPGPARPGALSSTGASSTTAIVAPRGGSGRG